MCICLVLSNFVAEIIFIYNLFCNKMKTGKSGIPVAVLTAVIFGLSSCVNSSEPEIDLKVVDFSLLNNDFNDMGYWDDCYDVNAGAVKVDGFSFSHTASAFEYDGVVYTSWDGFCPARVNDTSDHSSDWVSNQWATICPNPTNGIYFVGHSGANVSENALENTTCSVQMSNGGYFNPVQIFVCNSSYTYYVAKYGDAFSKKFTLDDELTLHVVGVRDGVMTDHLNVPLIKGGEYQIEWGRLPLNSLGTVDKMLFYIDSTAKNAYGLTVPAYFCVTSFCYTLPDYGIK